jgi:hypothetical protein
MRLILSSGPAGPRLQPLTISAAKDATRKAMLQQDFIKLQQLLQI